MTVPVPFALESPALRKVRHGLSPHSKTTRPLVPDANLGSVELSHIQIAVGEFRH